MGEHERKQDVLNMAQGDRLISQTIYEDSQTYNKMLFWKELFNKKKRKGIYKRNIALLTLKNNFVPEMIKNYNNRGSNIGKVSMATKEYVARAVLAIIEGV